MNLNANSLNYGQRIFDNAMQYYQDQEKFKAIAASYGVTINGNETIDEIRAKFLQSMTNNIKGPQ